MKKYIWRVWCGACVIMGCNNEIDVSALVDANSHCECPTDTVCPEKPDPGASGNTDVKTKLSFEDICLYSGGHYIMGGQCLCESEMCPEGVVCISDETGKATCAVHDKVADCRTGEMRCLEQNVVSCKNGLWTVDMPCEGDKPVCEHGVCVECQSGMTKCEDSQEYRCEYGNWVLDKACNDVLGCFGNQYCKECWDDRWIPEGYAVNGPDRCIDDHTLGTCIEGKMHAKVCENEGLCRFKDETQEFACMTCSGDGLDYKVIQDDIFTCRNGDWDIVEQCAHDVRWWPVCTTCIGDSVYCFADSLEGPVRAYACEHDFWVLKDVDPASCRDVYIKTKCSDD
ncbi:MAG: hypothetical protein IKY83_04780 [Proteobacteria bacterium]|nr:hypothetical protein [Pseudomonadota bacterium]